MLEGTKKQEESKEEISISVISSINSNLKVLKEKLNMIKKEIKENKGGNRNDI